LSEDVQQRRADEDGEQQEEAAPQPLPESAPLEIAVPGQVDSRGQVGDAARLGIGAGGTRALQQVDE
jgi:hypothetical protein